MTKIMKLVALGATMGFVAVCQLACAQDDLDALLKDLDGSAAKPAAAKPAAVEEAKPAEAAKPAEEAKPAAEEKPAVEAKAAEEAKAVPAPAAEPKAEAAVAEAAKPAEAKPAAAAPAPAPVNPEAELIANITATERLRRESLDAQARREILEARKSMENAEYQDAWRHYGLSLKLLNDRPASQELRKECNQGIAESLYLAALQEDEIGRRDRAKEYMEKALDMRHPKARKVLEKWVAEGEREDVAVDTTAISHRMNDEEYKVSREQIRKHLRRSRQYLALKDMKHALEECEVVLVNDPYNRDAIRLRNAIQKKRKVILQQEREAARDGMIADVDEAWRPVYAVNAAKLSASTSETIKTQAGEDPERTMEQEIERRMKEMRLPTISFKPPATIIDAVDFFRGASKDYDRPDIPIEKRGFNFVLKTPQGALKQQAGAAQESTDDFASNDSAEAAPSNGLPPIPTITASDITFYEALKLVCDSVDYKFIVRGPVVMVMQKDMSTAELLSRKYDVLDAFLERMTAASSDVKEMKSAGFGGGAKKADEGEENQEKDWKEFFSQMGVKWPEGSSIMYIKTLGKLYVRNTRENLAEFEKVLQEMGSQPKLIEIETRFVEVSQEDLNSLGFEWILNSDYSLNVGERLGKALGVAGSTWGTETGSRNWTSTANAIANRGRDGFAKSANEGNSLRTVSNITTMDSTSDDWLVDGQTKSGFPTSEAKTHRTSLTKNTTDSTISSSFRDATSSDYNNSRGMNVSDSYNRTVPYRSVGGNLIRENGGSRNLGFNAFGGTSDYQNGNRYLSTTGNHISGESGSTNDQFMRVNAFLGQADLSLILHMLSQRSDTDLLSAPKVVTKSGENAVIKVVTEYIYPQDYDVQLQSSSSGGSGSSSGGSQSAILAVVEPQNFTMREVGVILDVTPTYSEANGGTIDLELKPSVVDEPIWHNYGMRIPFTGNTSSGTMADIGGIFTGMATALETIGATLTPEETAQMAKLVVGSAMDSAQNVSMSSSANMTWYDAPMEQPFFHVRSIDSKVSITPGATVVMGGLITEARKAMDDKIPFLGDLPYIGRLFRSHAEQTIKRNLLIFVTGRLITPSGRELSMNTDESTEDASVKAAPKAE